VRRLRSAIGLPFGASTALVSRLLSNCRRRRDQQSRHRSAGRVRP
jgi:hypothetical protein